MYRVYFINFYYYSANIASNIEDAKKIAKEAGFDSIIELNNEAVCTYSKIYGFVNVHPPEIKLSHAG